MKFKTILFIVLCLIFASACQNKGGTAEKAVFAETMVAPGSDVSPPPPPPEAREQYDPKLIKRGELTISSKDIEQAKALVYRLAGECNGHVVNENFVNNEYYTCFDIVLSIQATYFDLFLNKLDSSGIHIASRSVSVEDITLKYIDDSTRLFNKKKLEGKYLDLLSKTNDIKNLLAIEEKLEEIRTDIEVKESQLKILDRQIAFSEFKIKIEKDDSGVTPEDRTKFTYRLGQGIAIGWEGMKGLVIFLFSVWPVYLLAAIVFFAIKLILKRRKGSHKRVVSDSDREVR